MADPSVMFKEERVTKPHDGIIVECAISPDGSLIATGSGDKTTSVIDAASGDVIYTSNHEGTVNGVAWHSDGNRFVSTYSGGTLIEFSRSYGKWSHQSVYKHSTNTYGCAVSVNGLVAAGGQDRCVVVLYSDSNYSVKQKIEGLTDTAKRLCFSSFDGSLLAIGCLGGTHYVYGYSQSNGKYEQLTKKKHHTNTITSISFSPTDTHLILGNDDNTASLWNVPSSPLKSSTWPQSPSFVLKGHIYSVNGTCFTGDGCHVITASIDKSIRIWRMSDGGHVETFHAKNHISSLSFNSPSGRLIVGLQGGSLQSWLCPPYGTTAPIAPTVPSFVDAHIRLSNAQNDLSDIESKLSSIDPSIRDAGARAAHLRKEIVRLQQLIDDHNKELTLIETDTMKAAFMNIASLEEQLNNANGEIFNCNRIIDHVTECYNTNGFFSSLQSGVCFDQWLFDSGMSHLIGQLDMDGDKLVHMSVHDLLESGLSYNVACDIHIRACLTAHMQTVGVLPGVFNWTATQVSTWLQSQGPIYSSLVNLGWTGPSLLALSPNRVESASNKTIRSDQARALREAIAFLISDDNSLPEWLRKWNGSQTIAEYGEL